MGTIAFTSIHLGLSWIAGWRRQECYGQQKTLAYNFDLVQICPQFILACLEQVSGSGRVLDGA